MQTISARGWTLLAIAGAVLVVAGCGGIPTVSPADIAIGDFNFAKQELLQTVKTSDGYFPASNIRFNAAYRQMESHSQDYQNFCRAYHAVLYAYQAAHDSENYREWSSLKVPELQGRFLQDYVPAYCDGGVL